MSVLNDQDLSLAYDIVVGYAVWYIFTQAIKYEH